MPNYPGPLTGQQAVTTAPAPLPSLIPANPMGNNNSWAGNTGAPLGVAAGVRGEGWRVLLTCIGNTTLFYGNNANVSTSNGKAVAPGAQDSQKLNDLAQLFVVTSANGNCFASWSVTVDP